MSMEKKIAEMIKERIGKDVEVSQKEIVKMNNDVRKAFCVKPVESNIAPTIYYDESSSDDEIVEYVVSTYIDKCQESPNIIDPNEIMTRDYIINNVYPVVVNHDRNSENMTDDPDGIVNLPYIEDLSITYKISVSINNSNDSGSITVRNKHLDVIGISVEELNEAALNNIKGKARIQSMFSILSIVDDSVPDTGAMIISNDSKCFGASVILDPEVDKWFKEFGDAYIIPSSVHELIAVPCSDDEDEERFLSEQIKTVNSTVLDPCDFLSDNLFKYDESGFHKVEVA